jgi:hypothetical protein
LENVNQKAINNMEYREESTGCHIQRQSSCRQKMY